MKEFFEIVVKIPEERIPVLIGKNGDVKKRIENELKIKLEINKKENSVKIIYDTDHALNALKAKNIVLAIGRGFSPGVAFKLLNDEFVLEIIDLSEIVSSRKELIRQRGRIIGEKGRCRKFFEDTLNVNLAIYGKTVSIIGKYEEVSIAREGILMLAEGKSHASVYRFLERKALELRERRFYEAIYKKD